MSDSVENQLYYAAEIGSASVVSSLLKDNPGINVNWQDPNQWTPLHAASMNGHHKVVKLLLAHPDIDVNLRNRGGETPFLLGCLNCSVSVVEVLLKDPRVDVTLADNRGCTPLWYASRNAHQEVIEWLMASGRDLGDIMNKKGKTWDGKDYTALEIAQERNRTKVVSVPEKFLANPALTRHELRVKLGMLDALAAELYAVTVFPLRWSSSTQGSFSPCWYSQSCFCHSLLCHCQEVANGAADDAVSSRRWLNKTEYSLQGFGGCLQITCQESSS